MTPNRILPPAACYAACINLLALAAGAVRPDALRIVDLATQETADVIQLPCTLAVAGAWPGMSPGNAKGEVDAACRSLRRSVSHNPLWREQLETQLDYSLPDSEMG